MDQHSICGQANGPPNATSPAMRVPFGQKQNREDTDFTTECYNVARQPVAYPPMATSSADDLNPSDMTAQTGQKVERQRQDSVQDPIYTAIGFDGTSGVLRLYSVSGNLPPGTDTLTFPVACGLIASVHGLHAGIIEDKSPLIAAAFESTRSGQRLHLEALSEQTALPFVRFLYTGSYAESGDWEDVPTSLLLHCKMSHLGDIYDMPDLISQAYVNILRQCEFGCSSPDKPIDLCSAINFTYENLFNHGQIADAIVHYCVSCFLSHNLGEHAEFKALAYHLRAFHQDLTKACKDRDYADESAAAIIQMPYKHFAPDTYASTETPAIARFEDLIHHFHSSDRFDEEASPKKRQRVTPDKKPDCLADVRKQPETSDPFKISLPLRPYPATAFTFKGEEGASSSSKSLPIRQHGRTPSQSQHLPIWKRRHFKDSHDAPIDGGFAQLAEDSQASVRPAWDQRYQRYLKMNREQHEESNDFGGKLQRALEASIAESPVSQLPEPESSNRLSPQASDKNSAWDWEDWGPDPSQVTTTVDANKPIHAPEHPTAVGESASLEPASTEDGADEHDSDSDEDELSWVDVALEPATRPEAANSTPAKTQYTRSMSSDSEWDFCSV